MPELPEVETTVRDLREFLPGRTFDKLLWADWPKMLHTHAPDELGEALIGEQIVALHRRAKYIAIELTNDKHLVFHRKMTGNLFWREAGATPDRFTHLALSFTDGSELRFADSRKFGRVYFYANRQGLDDLFQKLGPEPLLDTFTKEDFSKIIGHRKGMLKPLLLNQALLVGLGNIYVNEALFVSGLHPKRQAASLSHEEQERLYHAIRFVLNKGIANRGTTLSDYLDGKGEKGTNQDDLMVHFREGQPCRTCATPILKINVGQRSSYFCPTCQGTGEIQD